MEERKEEPEGVVACDLGESRNLAFNQQLGDLRIVTASRATPSPPPFPCLASLTTVVDAMTTA